jgi:hypothetical protein
MSLNPILLEMMAKERQRELLAMARPHVVPVPMGHRKPILTALRVGMARLLIRIGLRLKPMGSLPACPLCHGGGGASDKGSTWWCRCPKRDDVPNCQPLRSG